MAPPNHTIPLHRTALFEDMTGLVRPMATPSGGAAVRLDDHPRSASPRLSDRVRSGQDRRSRDRGRERRSVQLAGANYGESPLAAMNSSIHGSIHGLVKQDPRHEVATWFDDLRWGTPLARKLAGVGLTVAFLAFVVLVLITTFSGQAVL